MKTISQSAINLIVREEVSGKAYYEKHYTRPEWPGYSSGATVGIGYDLGQQKPGKIRADWGGVVSNDILEAMVECAGITGTAAKSVAARMQSRIIVTWEQAMAVFLKRDVPNWIAMTYKALPNCDYLSSTCLGVLVSLNYNRGTGGYTKPDDRYLELREIKQAMIAKRFDRIPDALDRMARLWPGSGVAGRRHREADLFRAGLKEPMGATSISTVPEPDHDVIKDSRPDAPARTKPPATTNAQNGTAGGIVVGGLTGAAKAAQSGMTTTQVILILIATVVVAGGVWYAWYRNRNPQDKQPIDVIPAA